MLCYLCVGQLLECGPSAGFALGVADKELFLPPHKPLGVQPHSWCLSRTGKKSNGITKFVEFTQQIEVCLCVRVEFLGFYRL